ncbi:hypothetical protein F4679DRAFT_395940 [Xylaria curta]|nr:hypothetical protein F4679DRAFT_395940 [Xylaria curta]
MINARSASKPAFLSIVTYLSLLVQETKTGDRRQNDRQLLRRELALFDRWYGIFLNAYRHAPWRESLSTPLKRHICHLPFAAFASMAFSIPSTKVFY